MTLLSFPYMPTVCVIAGIVWAVTMFVCYRIGKMSRRETIGKREAALKWWREELTDLGRSSLTDAIYPGRFEESLTGREIELLKEKYSHILIEDDIKK